MILDAPRTGSSRIFWCQSSKIVLSHYLIWRDSTLKRQLQGSSISPVPTDARRRLCQCTGPTWSFSRASSPSTTRTLGIFSTWRLVFFLSLLYSTSGTYSSWRLAFILSLFYIMNLLDMKVGIYSVSPLRHESSRHEGWHFFCLLYVMNILDMKVWHFFCLCCTSKTFLTWRLAYCCLCSTSKPVVGICAARILLTWIPSSR